MATGKSPMVSNTPLPLLVTHRVKHLTTVCVGVLCFCVINSCSLDNVHTDAATHLKAVLTFKDFEFQYYFIVHALDKNK